MKDSDVHVVLIKNGDACRVYEEAMANLSHN